MVGMSWIEAGRGGADNQVEFQKDDAADRRCAHRGANDARRTHGPSAEFDGNRPGNWTQFPTAVGIADDYAPLNLQSEALDHGFRQHQHGVGGVYGDLYSGCANGVCIAVTLLEAPSVVSILKLCSDDGLTQFQRSLRPQSATAASNSRPRSSSHSQKERA